MNKKILALITTLAMLTASFSMSFAAVPSDVVGRPVEEAVERLVALEVITGYPDGSFRPDEKITRAEYAAVATRALGLEQLAMSQKGPTNFGDVAANGWSSGYINVAEQKGIIKGMGIINGVNTFGPSLNIKYEQAVTIIVRALGYEQAALDKGGYPDGHLLVASQEGLLQGVNSSKGTLASRGLVAQLTYNALSVPMMIEVNGNYIQSGTQGTDAVYIFNYLNLINKAAASGDWGSIDEDTFADAGITGITASNLAIIQNELQTLAGGDNQNWSPAEIQGVFDNLVIPTQPSDPMEITYIDPTSLELDGVDYTLAVATVLRNEVGVLEQTGGAAIAGFLSVGDKVFDVVANNNKRISSFKYVAAEADKDAAQDVIDLIEALDPASSSYATDITAARKAYDGTGSGTGSQITTTLVQQNLVSNLADLLGAESSEAFKIAHNTFLTTKNVGNIAIGDQAALTVVVNAYNAQTPESKALLVDEKDLLDDLQAKIDSLVAAQALLDSNQFRITHAGILAETLATVSVADQAALTAARVTNWATLTPEAQALLTAEKALLDSLQARLTAIGAVQLAQAGTPGNSADRASMEAALQNPDLGLNLTAYNALPIGAQKNLVLDALLGLSTTYTDRASVQTDLDAQL